MATKVPEDQQTNMVSPGQIEVVTTQPPATLGEEDVKRLKQLLQEMAPSGVTMEKNTPVALSEDEIKGLKKLLVVPTIEEGCCFFPQPTKSFAEDSLKAYKSKVEAAKGPWCLRKTFFGACVPSIRLRKCAHPAPRSRCTYSVCRRKEKQKNDPLQMWNTCAHGDWKEVNHMLDILLADLPMGNPLLAALLMAVWVLGCYGIAAGWQKAKVSMNKPAMRSSMINIPRNTEKIKTFPNFVLLVCPTDPDPKASFLHVTIAQPSVVAKAMNTSVKAVVGLPIVASPYKGRKLASAFTDAEFASGVIESSSAIPSTSSSSGLPTSSSSGNPSSSSSSSSSSTDSSSSSSSGSSSSSSSSTSSSTSGSGLSTDDGGFQNYVPGDDGSSTDAPYKPIIQRERVANGTFPNGTKRFIFKNVSVAMKVTPPHLVNMTRLGQQGLLRPRSKGGMLPLFGFVDQKTLARCYEIRTFGGMKPNYKYIYVDPRNETVPVASSSFTAAVKTTGPVTVAAYSTAFGRTIRDLRSFTLLRPDELPLLIHPHITGTYYKVLEPWTGSRPQVSALLKGMATKKAKNPVYNLSWALDLTYHGDGQSSALTYNAARLSSVLNSPLPAHKVGGNYTFFMNFQPYFMSFNVAVMEDFYTYDYLMAINNTLVFLSAIGMYTAFVKALPQCLGNCFMSARKFVTELRAGNLQAAFCAGSDVAGAAGAAHKHGAAAHGANETAKTVK